MKQNWTTAILIVKVWILILCCLIEATAAEIHLVSSVAGTGKVSNSANGDSVNPIISADGRYVIFSSSARNLVPTNQMGSVSRGLVHWQNVYLRDRMLGSNVLVSCNSSGVGGNWNSWPFAISTNGQYVLFGSSADDLVAGDNNRLDDLFVRDMANGLTSLVSVNTNGVAAMGISRNPVMTPDGRYVAFTSYASDLVTNDTNGIPDVFMRDMFAGTTTLVSVGASSTKSAQLPSISDAPVITPNGRYVAFHSTATNLVTANVLAGDIYLRDLINETTTWVSTNARSLFKVIYGTTNVVACSPAISDNGRFVSYLVASAALSKGMILQYDLQTGGTIIIQTNAYAPAVGSDYSEVNTLDQTPDGRFIAYQANNLSIGGFTYIYLYDALLGTNILVSADVTNGTPVSGFCDSPVVDASGRYVTFMAIAAGLSTNLPMSGLSGGNLYRRDVQLGTGQSVDVNTNGYAAGIGSYYSISADGRQIVFDTSYNGYVPGDFNGDYDVILRDMVAGTNELIPICHPRMPSLAPNNYSKFNSTSLSTNGQFVVFVSESNNLGPDDTNKYYKVYLSDMLQGSNILVSIGTNGSAALNASGEPSISGNGRYVAYSSYAKNLVVGDTNNAQDVFIYDSQTGSNQLVSARPLGGFGNRNSHAPLISADGSFVLYTSQSDNLANGSFGVFQDNIFLRNLSQKTNYALTTGSVVNASMTLDGRYVAYIGVSDASKNTNLYVWDSLNARRIYTNVFSSLTNVAISPDGHWVAYTSGGSLYAYDLIGKSNYLTATANVDTRFGLQWSTDDRILAFVTKTKILKSDTNGVNDVYLHDFLVGTNILVSRSYATTNAANDSSDLFCFSPDGRFVAYRSIASDIVPGNSHALRDLYVYDRITGATLLITADPNGFSNANMMSGKPVFSADSKNLFFVCYATDLASGGLPEYNAIYSLSLYPSAIVDTDGDGMDDQWEMDHFGTLERDGTGDWDGDGASDLAEFLANTDPNDANSVLNVSLNRSANQSPLLSWPVASGRFYRVQYKNDLTDPDWHDLGNGATMTGNIGQAVDAVPSQSQRFYRVLLSN